MLARYCAMVVSVRPSVCRPSVRVFCQNAETQDHRNNYMQQHRDSILIPKISANFRLGRPQRGRLIQVW